MTSKLTGEGDDDDEVKKIIDIFNFKQRLLSIDMKIKVVQYVQRINLSHFNFEILNLNFEIFKFFLVPSFCLTFRHFFTSASASPSPVTLDVIELVPS